MNLTDKIILRVKDLTVAFDTEAGRVRAIENVGFELEKGTFLGIVGESGCGKSVTALTIMRLLPQPAGVIEKGNILLDRTDLLELSVAKMQKVRGNQIAMIFQEPMTALNPVHKIGRQLSEVFQIHYPELNQNQVKQKSVALLQKVGIPEPEMRLADYPHQISGGMRQRVMIAMALAGQPEILIADEPTTALDVTIQAQILELLKTIQQETAMSVILITHDLAVIAETCDKVVVMYAGKIVETAPVIELFQNPKHPYTQGLLNSIPRLTTKPKTRLKIIEGMVPSLLNMPAGCCFHNRCPLAKSICQTTLPLPTHFSENHMVKCHLYSGD